MQQKLIQIAGIVWTVVYASIIVWIYATEPRSFNEVTTNTRVAAGIYEVNQEKFNNGLELFRRDQFHAARDVWASADPAQQDPRTQFYIAYACYREGWGRVYYDDALFKQARGGESGHQPGAQRQLDDRRSESANAHGRRIED